MIATLVQFLLGLVILALGGGLLIRGSSRLASELGVSRLFIGLTVVAFGTSAPEAAVSVMAALSGSTDMALGNLVGSNIFNILLILGLAALIIPLSVSSQVVRFDLPFLVTISGLFLLLAYDGSVGFLDGLLLLALLALHIFISYRKGIRAKGPDGRSGVVDPLEAPADFPRRNTPWKGLLLNAIIVVAGLAFLVFGSRWLVASASIAARWLGLSELVIGLTVIAIGTSLPEVATSITAACRGESDIAVGNVVGSNIFNILGVLGFSAVAAPGGVAVSPAVLSFHLPVMVAVAVLCLPIFFTDMAVLRWEGGVLLGYFVLYTMYLLLRATDHHTLHEFTVLVKWVIIPITVLTLVAATIANLLERRGKGGHK
ncbi:MAG: calcium/sodium antiporter [Deltaproteobacteria bacterium]|nr:calcium/sodium antiporter [Deltaproteobacteria bacterium]